MQKWGIFFSLLCVCSYFAILRNNTNFSVLGYSIMKYQELVINADHVGQYVLATHFIMKCTQCCMTLPRLCTHSEHTEMTRDFLYIKDVFSWSLLYSYIFKIIINIYKRDYTTLYSLFIYNFIRTCHCEHTMNMMCKCTNLYHQFMRFPIISLPWCVSLS